MEAHSDEPPPWIWHCPQWALDCNGQAWPPAATSIYHKAQECFHVGIFLCSSWYSVSLSRVNIQQNLTFITKMVATSNSLSVRSHGTLSPMSLRMTSAWLDAWWSGTPALSPPTSGTRCCFIVSQFRFLITKLLHCLCLQGIQVQVLNQQHKSIIPLSRLRFPSIQFAKCLSVSSPLGLLYPATLCASSHSGRWGGASTSKRVSKESFPVASGLAVVLLPGSCIAPSCFVFNTWNCPPTGSSWDLSCLAKSRPVPRKFHSAHHRHWDIPFILTWHK